MTDDAADGFLSRWSRRKRAVVRGPVVDVTDAPVPGLPIALVVDTGFGEALAADDGSTEAAPRPAFDPASLPAPETLTATSDITGFLRAEVPAALRRAALRRIWTLDPGIRDFIGPADYAWDYNAPDGVPGFALQLGGDAQKLLAQAMGWQPEAAPDAVVRHLAEASGPSPMPMQEAEPEAEPAAIAAAPDPVRQTEAQLDMLPVDHFAAVEAISAMPAGARRHGSARPS